MMMNSLTTAVTLYSQKRTIKGRLTVDERHTMQYNWANSRWIVLLGEVGKDHYIVRYIEDQEAVKKIVHKDLVEVFI